MNDEVTDDRVFAAYGRAMNSAQVLEHWLRALVAIHRTASKEFGSHEEVEQAVAALSASTMGMVFAALRKIRHDDALEAQLAEAVAGRNRLAHLYFVQWGEKWGAGDFNLKMIKDADEVRALFEQTVARLIAVIGTHLDTIGENPDLFVPGLESRVNRFVAAAEQSADR